MNNKSTAYIFIEAIIVLSLIIILGTIATSNYLEAKEHSKISRAKIVLREADACLEAYRTDYDNYPYDGYNYSSGGNHLYGYWFLPPDLSTPVAYCPTVEIDDPFRAHIDAVGIYGSSIYNNIRYTNINSTWGLLYSDIKTNPSNSIYLERLLVEVGDWRLVSAGPDKLYGPTAWDGVTNYPALTIPYDPTNGLFSSGDFIRSQNVEFGYLNTN